MDKVSISGMVKKLKETLTMHSDIVLVFLFGSFPRGETTSFSDLDIALFFTGAIDFYRINELKEEIMDKQDIFVLNLQRAVQAAIDLATHIVASEGLGLSDTIRDNFKLLKNGGIINEELTHKMESMVGFRNIAIHDYQAIDKNILKSILSNNLKDLEDFYTTVLLYLKVAAQ